MFGNLWFLMQVCAFALGVSKLSFQLKNYPCFLENVVFANLSLRALDFRDGREKSLISKGIFPQIN
jgi:hypothetical protein